MTETQYEVDAPDEYLSRLDERIRHIGNSSWGDEANKQGVLSGLLAARELYLHPQEKPSAWARDDILAAAIGAMGIFPLDMAEVRCPRCFATAYPDSLGEALDWGLAHRCDEGQRA